LIVFFIFVLFPDFFGCELAGKRLLVVSGPDWEVSEVLSSFEPGAASSLASNVSRLDDLRSVSVFR